VTVAEPIDKRTAIVGAFVISLLPTSAGGVAGTFLVNSSTRVEEKLDRITSRMDKLEGARTAERIEELDRRVRDLEIATAKERR
jgi:hypothetical protein